MSCLDGVLAMRRAEVVICASSFNQARIVFEHCLDFYERKIDKNRKQWRIQDSQNNATITYRPSRTRIRCIGSDPRRAHGLAPRICILDEPAQWEQSKAEKMYVALDTSLGKIPDSKLIAIGTRPAEPTHFFSRLLRTADYSQTHSVPKKRKTIFQQRTWQLANPSLKHMPDLLAKIRREASKAKKDANLLAGFKALRLNMGVSDILENYLCEVETWRKVETKEQAPYGSDRGAQVWGLDLSGGSAMAAIACYSDDNWLDAIAAFPKVPDLKRRGLADGVGRAYQTMYDRGELLTMGQNVVPTAELLDYAVDYFGGYPLAIFCDRYKKNDLLEALHESSIPKSVEVIFRGQGYLDGSEDLRRFRNELLNGRIITPVSKLVRSSISEARTVSDPAGNTKLSKSTEGGRRSRARDDVVAAGIMAVSGGSRIFKSRRPRPNAPKRKRYHVIG